MTRRAPAKANSAAVGQEAAPISAVPERAVPSQVRAKRRSTATSAAERAAEIARRVLRQWHEAVPDDRMAHLVKDATRGFLRALQLRLAGQGVQIGQWRFLRILWQRDGVTQRELSVQAGVTEPTTVVALRAMQALGYVRLEQRANNRKNVYVVLTPLGQHLKKQLVPLAEEVNAVALQGLSEADLAATRRALLRMIDNLAQQAAAT